MKCSLFKFFRGKVNSGDDFPAEQFSPLPKGERYPSFSPLGKRNVYAHSAQFMIQPEDLSVVECLIGLFFHGKIIINEAEQRFVLQGKALICYKFNELGQDVVKIITNDNEFIKCLCDKGLEPPGPETVFPDKNFSHYGSLQGEMAFWWDIYWEPFWKSLSDDEKKHYLGRNHHSVDTLQFLHCRH